MGGLGPAGPPPTAPAPCGTAAASSRMGVSRLSCLSQGGIFQLRVTFSEQYPEKPPRVRFTSEIFHPNVGAAAARSAPPPLPLPCRCTPRSTPARVPRCRRYGPPRPHPTLLTSTLHLSSVLPASMPHTHTHTHIAGSPYRHLCLQVYSDGTLCLDIIQDQWSPCHNICRQGRRCWRVLLGAGARGGRGAGKGGARAGTARAQSAARHAGKAGGQARKLLPIPTPAPVAAASSHPSSRCSRTQTVQAQPTRRRHR